MSSKGIKKNIYRAGLNCAAKMLGVKRAKCFDSCFRFGRRLNLDNPTTLSDKVSWIELNTDQTLAAQCTDKFAVREYVKEKGLAEILVPLVGGPWTDADQIDIDALPGQFVLKATHGCEMNYVCKDKSELDQSDLMAKAARWLKEDYSRACIEPHYKLVPHRLYAEQFIGGIDDLVDYKFHCLNGEPAFVLTCFGRESSVKKSLYDLKWNHIDGIQGRSKTSELLSRPSKLEDMVDIARCLSKDFDFVRVDLYEVGGSVMFGELTFSPAGGIFPNFTDEFVAKWGEVLHVEGLE